MSFHGNADCDVCHRNIVRDMYGVWYHTPSALPPEKAHDPAPPQDILIKIRRSEMQGAQHAAYASFRKEVERLAEEYDTTYSATWGVSVQAILDALDERLKQ